MATPKKKRAAKKPTPRRGRKRARGKKPRWPRKVLQRSRRERERSRWLGTTVLW